MNKIQKALILVTLALLLTISAMAQIKPTATYEYVKRDSSLYLDLYKSANSAENYTVVLFSVADS